MHILEKIAPYQKAKVQEIIEQGKHAKKYGTVFFGDSHMQYLDVNHYFPMLNVYNCGLEGATSDLLFHLREYAITPFEPRKVFIMIGTNDLGDAWQVDKLEIAFNVYRLIEILRRFSPFIDVYVISPLPIDERYQTRLRDNNQLKLLGKEIANNVNEFSGCVYIDVFEDFLKDGVLHPEYTIDGMHLNQTGYDVLVEKIRKYVEE